MMYDFIQPNTRILDSAIDVQVDYFSDVLSTDTTIQSLSSDSMADNFSLPTISIAEVTDRFNAYRLERYLKDRLHTYATPFSLIPPGQYIRIQRIGVEAPIVNIDYASAEQMEQGAFNDELKVGVVKYPFTALP